MNDVPEALTPLRTTGVLTHLAVAEDDRGRTVLRATVDFYDGAAPDISFKTIFNATPVTIVEIISNSGEQP